jgi:hypothetical protein
MSKGMVTLILSVGGTIGSYLPVLLGAGSFSAWSIIGGVVGALGALWLSYKLFDF